MLEDKPSESRAPVVDAVRTNIFYSGEVYFRRWFRFWGMEARGQLQLSRNCLRFSSGTVQIDCQPTNARMVWQSSMLGYYLISNCVIVAGISARVFETLTWDNPATIPLLIGMNLLIFLIHGPVYWVEVESKATDGAVKRLYFRDGSAFAWLRPGRGAAGLLAQLWMHVFSDDQKSHASDAVTS
ncbi:MAG: hypothetical protein L0215_10385 [Gemmataceae bacterium]|nr:hypothetical protein [Gemmataceae bacterium]